MPNISWQQQLRESVSSPAILFETLGLSTESLPECTITDKFPLRVTQSFIQRMEKGNPNDPLLQQIIPLYDETIFTPGFNSDPVGEQQLREKDKIPGLLHKYHGRVLLVTTGACAIHCRYCFRRDYPYDKDQANVEQWSSIMSYIKKDKSITEVILSGGDPLILSDEKLAVLILQLKETTHIKRLRIHTRVPIVLPDRITDKIIQLFSSSPLQIIFVVHSNHPNEINDQVGETLKRLNIDNITVLNQSVLLKNINDKADIIGELNEKLFQYGTLPYYLHMLDKVEGAAHFEVPDKTAKNVMHELRSKLPGYLVPRLVREEAGAPYKIPIL